MITLLSTENLGFPPAENALTKPNGLLAIGGDLSVERLLMAYQQGIFPWFSLNDPIMWWSPNPRAIICPSKAHFSRSLLKFLRKSAYRFTINQDFIAVITGCASNRQEGTWITQDIMQAYLQLHLIGKAHSFEVWEDDQLIGGLYGVSVGSVFCGESMFSLKSNASKCAFYALCHHFHHHGGQLIDCQILNHHTRALGAYNIPRKSFLSYLKNYKIQDVNHECWHQQQIFII